jgi:hypothetical protein
VPRALIVCTSVFAARVIELLRIPQYAFDMVYLTMLRRRLKADVKRLDLISREMNASLLVIAIGLAALDVSVFTALNVQVSVPNSGVNAELDDRVVHTWPDVASGWGE